MSLSFIAVIVIGLLAAAYFTYGRFLARHFDLHEERVTPAHDLADGIDYVPTPKGFLLAQHFSAIAAAGPIVGPILAGLWFGWLPVLLWIVIGGVFFGAVHDFSSLVGSIRHRGHSIVELVNEYFGRRGYLIFLVFVWLSLLYVITAFTDLTSHSFVEPDLGGGVATSSLLYLALGAAMGVCLSRFRMPLGRATLLFMPLVLFSIWLGQKIPLVMPSAFGMSPQQIWNIVLILYCFAASIIPVWVLLQPRGYLGGIFLYGTLAAGVIGLFMGGEQIHYPAFTGFHAANGLPMFPLLFVTVACGACSGFHGIVCSGTTSKQVDKETDSKLLGYGGMLLESLVAVIALSTVMILAKGDALTGSSPDRIYAEGLSRFVSNLGVPRDFARAFVLLAFTTFIYDTLDVATRLTRHLLQELTGWKGRGGRIAATLLSLAIPLFCVSVTMTDPQGNLIPAWRVFWTIFGTSNQLLAALTLLILSTWLMKNGKSAWISIVPMIFMFAMTLWSLGIVIRSSVMLFIAKGRFDAVGPIAVLLFLLAAALAAEAFKAWRNARSASAAALR